MKMIGDIILDTNILVAFFNNDQKIFSNFRDANVLYLPATVLGELYFGAQKSIQTEKNLYKIQLALETVTVLPTDQETAKAFGIIRNDLQKQGTPIPDNDIWIGALALQHSLPVVTRDKHFNNIKSIQIINW